MHVDNNNFIFLFFYKKTLDAEVTRKEKNKNVILLRMFFLKIFAFKKCEGRL